MNPAVLENQIQLESEKYVLDLEKRFVQSEFNNTIITFLKSIPHKFLLLETSDTSATAWKLLQVLRDLQCLLDFTTFNDYLLSQNQTMIKWVRLSEILKSSQAVPNFKNLLVCEFDESASINDELIRTVLERLNFAIKRKVIFIISSKDNAFSKKINGDSSIYFNESKNMIMPFYDVSNESLIDRASCGDVSAVKNILDNGVDVNGTGSNGQTALHEAAARGREGVALLLLRYGANHLPDSNGDTPLHYASKNGHEILVKLFLENNIDVNIKGTNEGTALHYAALFGHKDVAFTLIKHGAKHLPDKNNDTPFHCATTNGHEDIVKLLLEHYIVDVNIEGPTGRTALHYAALFGHKDLVLTLLQHGAKHLHDINKDTPLHCASEYGHEDVVKLFLDNDVADVDIKGPLERTALHYAALSGHRDLALTLLKYGAKHLPDEKMDTPLHCAATNGHENVVELFLANDVVDVNIEGPRGQTALHYAALFGHTDLVSTLLKHGAKHLPDNNDETPLHCATTKGHEDVVKVFLENNVVDVNIKGAIGRTALHYAALFGYKDIALTLLNHGAKHLPDNHKDRPLHLAVCHRNRSVVFLFLRYGVDVNIKGNRGMTALHYAIEYRTIDIIVALLKNGADINLRNNKNKSVLDLADYRQIDMNHLIEKASKEIAYS